MVYYPVPKYISKSVLKKADPYEWSERDKRVTAVATTSTCLRCAQGVAVGKKLCKKPEQKRCAHCVKGNRGGCFLVPGDMVGKLNRLYRLRSKYDTAVSNSDNPRISAVVLSAGAKLARCQRQFNLELATRRRTAAHTGTPIGRRIAVALEQAVKHLAHSNGMAGEGDDSDDSDDPSTPGDGESQAGGSGSAGGSNSGSEEGEEEETGGNGETGGGGGEGVEGDGGN
ncbi:hypothetical protein AG0111_0g12727 [Alternaria gaisen]|uniref:Uncharacterized protein n=1 Tax=Alternaria gaisen TaxID=167740 RepID=A0ACB6F3P2_9PLEO|nr:hypothetical protein AG0111_0g12727 [Alternaria gaisen]